MMPEQTIRSTDRSLALVAAQASIRFRLQRQRSLFSSAYFFRVTFLSLAVLSLVSPSTTSTLALGGEPPNQVTDVRLAGIAGGDDRPNPEKQNRVSCVGNAFSIILDVNQSQYLFIRDQDQSGLDLTSDFTFETWLKLTSFPVDADYSIVTKSEGAPNKSYAIRLLENSGAHSVRILTTADGSTNYIADIDLLHNLELDTWYHVAVVYVALDGTGEVFLDGVSQGISAALSSSIADTAAEFQIGGWSSNGGHFDGYFDDIRVWARAKSQAEILATKDQELSGSEPDLRGYWKLNSSPADSTTFGNNLAKTNDPQYSLDVPEWASSGSARAYSILLDFSQGQYLVIQDEDQLGLDLANDFTFETWLKLPSFPVAADYSIVTKSEGEPNKSYVIRLQENFGVNRVGIITRPDGSTNHFANIDLLQNLEIDRWYHLAVVYVALDGTGEVFLDGVSQGISGGLSNSIADTSSEFQVGGWSSNGGYYNGYLDDFRVWARARSQAEILATKDEELSGSEQGLRGYWKLNCNPVDSSPLGNNLTEVNGPQYSLDVPEWASGLIFADGFESGDTSSWSNAVASAH